MSSVRNSDRFVSFVSSHGVAACLPEYGPGFIDGGLLLIPIWQ
jgi:hypothetical protein